MEGLTQVKKDENGEESRISSHEEIVFCEHFLSHTVQKDLRHKQ